MIRFESDANEGLSRNLENHNQIRMQSSFVSHSPTSDLCNLLVSSVSRENETTTTKGKGKKRRVTSVRIAATHAHKNKLDENVARPKDQIADYGGYGTHFHVPWPSSRPTRVPGPGPPRSLFRLIAAPTAHPVYARWYIHTSLGASARVICKLRS